MRIITESNSLDVKGGVELCTLQDSSALAQRGHKIIVAFGADGVFRSQFEDSGVEVEGPFSFDVDFHRPLGGLIRLVRPAQWARRLDPDVLWLQRFEHIVWAQAVSRWSACPIVCHLHHKPNFNRTSVLGRGVAHFIAVSGFMRDRWIEAGLEAERISVITNALPPGEYPRGGTAELAAARLLLGLPPEATIVLYYGHVSEGKGVGTLLEAWVELAASCDQLVLVIVGAPSPDLDPILAERFKAVDASTIRVFPMQSNVVPFLHAADLVVVPSWLDEGFGRVVLEGMATGRPVIATRAGAIPEILSGPLERFLVEPRDSEELATRIASLLDWRKSEPSLGEDCAAWADTNYPYSDHVLDLERVLLKHCRSR